MILSIRIESSTPEEAELLKQLNDEWPFTINVTVGGTTFKTGEYEEVR